ncbi:MAG: acetate/propionate family kinase [Candidatus Berkiellales bacterium]
MTHKHIGVINAGSSSIKFAFFDVSNHLTRTLYGLIENIKTKPVFKIVKADGSTEEISDFPQSADYHYLYQFLFSYFAERKMNVLAVGHRVVHGGKEYTAPTKITPEIIQDLKKYNSFAPLHQPYNLQAIEIIHELLPQLTQVACFDTAFHRTHPPVADTFGLPRSYTQAGIHRYGFHGLSYEYIVHHLTEKSSPLQEKMIVAHLGNGASLCAIKEGKSIDSTMGFTAVDGLLMGTRCGSLDPGVILFLLDAQKMTCQEIENLLYTRSGLLGVSGISSNMQVLLNDHSPNAQEAIELFVYRICREIGALMSVLKGLDRLVFTGGIGEHAAPIREKVCQEMSWAGIKIDRDKNNQHQSIMSDPQSKVEVCVIPTNEEWMIARHTYSLVKTN